MECDGSPGAGDARRGEGASQRESGRDPLKVCFFSHSADLAGAERTLLELVTQLIDDHGACCTVVVPGDGPLVARLERAGSEVIRTEYRWWCDTEPIPEEEADRRMAEGLTRLHDQILPAVATFDPDVICTQTIVIPYGAMAAWELDTPHIWSLREYAEGVGFHFFKPFAEVAAFIRDHSDFVFGANRGLCRRLIPNLPEEVHDVLYPVVEIPPLRPAEKELEIASEDGRFRLAEFATVSPLKRLDVVINAVGELVRRGRSVELVIAGAQVPTYVAELEAFMRSMGLQDCVEIRAFMDNVYPQMAAADAVVISAPVHTFGRTAVEGMSLAKPVVYPLGTGFDDYLEDGGTGLGYRAGDPQAMADRIDALIRDPGLGPELGRNARAAARALFTRDGFGGKFYRRALALRDRDPGPVSR